MRSGRPTVADGVFRRVALRAAVCAMAGAAGGCGQYFKVEVVRLTPVVADPSSPLTGLRESIASSAEALADVLEPIEQTRVQAEREIARRYSEVRDGGGGDAAAIARLERVLSQTKPVPSIRRGLLSVRSRTGLGGDREGGLAGATALAALAEELNGLVVETCGLENGTLRCVVPLNPVEAQLASDEYGRSPEDATAVVRAKIGEIRNRIEIEVVSAAAEVRTDGRGYLHRTSFEVSPVDPLLNEIRRGYRPAKRVYNEVVIAAAGETEMLLVQESPASFRKLSLTADPTDVLKNTLAAINQVLQVTAALGPVIGVPIPPVSLPGVAPAADGSSSGVVAVPASAFNASREAQMIGLRVVANGRAMTALDASLKSTPSDTEDVDDLVRSVEVLLASTDAVMAMGEKNDNGEGEGG